MSAPIELPVESGPRTAAHALRRLGFGPRPGDVRRVLDQGLPDYIWEQLHPSPDTALDARFQAFTTLGLTVPQCLASSAADALFVTRLHEELRSAKLIRATHSRNQLQEVLADFWFNHFNIYLLDDFQRLSTPAYERDAIRPFVLGRFRDLLGATANHVAMMAYLDNYLSTVSRVQNGVLRQGLNENYGRELMELHTLGVDAGYTQEDVFDAARCFTGWGIDNIATGGNFMYRPANHDTGSKSVFGLGVPAGGGKDDGERVLDYLAAHTATARFLATKLARRFVADDPPAALVDRCAGSFTQSGGDLTQVLITLVTSPEFWEDAFSATGKQRTPFEYAAGSLRALDAQVTSANALRGQISGMGMPLYECIPPTGYSDRGGDWMNASSHLQRMNFALDLAAGRIAGVSLDLPATLRAVGAEPADARSVAIAMNTEALGGRLARESLETISGVATGTNPTIAAKAAGLSIASAAMQVK